MEKIAIYEVFEGKIKEAFVRETKKLYVLITSGRHFGYRSQFHKHEVHLTPMEAVDHKLAQLRDRYEIDKRNIERTRTDLELTEKLKKKLNPTP